MKSFLGNMLLLALLAASTLTSTASTLYFWDINGAASGCGSATPNGTWGTAANWTANGGGTATTVAWPAGELAVFSAGGGTCGTGDYTVTVEGNQQVGDIHVDVGNVTLQGGTLSLAVGSGWDVNNRLISVGHFSATATARFNTVLAAANGVIKYKIGKVFLGATNTFTGTLAIEGGTIELAVPQAINPACKLELANDRRGGLGLQGGNPSDTPATFATGGFSQTLAALRVSGTNTYTRRTIDFGDGASALTFANSSAEDWNAEDFSGPVPLHIVNYTPSVDSLRFGTDATGLTEQQLSQIVFDDFSNLPAQIDEQGFVRPGIPRVKRLQGAGSSDVAITWNSIPYRYYRIQYATDLTESTAWTDLTPDVSAETTTTTVTHSIPADPKRYYRVILIP